MTQFLKNIAMGSLVLALLAGCSSLHRAPVDEAGRNVAATPSPYPPLPKDCTQTWTVRKGDTLISIALDAGADYRDIAAMNQLSNPNIVQLDRTLCVRRSSSKSTKKVAPTTSVQPTVKVEQPVVDSKVVAPKKLAQDDTTTATSSSNAVPTGDGIRFAWPAKGKVIAGFNESSNKGINIAGAMGDPVVAAADGKVVYAGSGLRGYGNLVIVKHDGNYLTAYAYNSKILVKEGDVVKRGQRIAEMGDSDADRVMLHFEVRYQGKPVDPLKFLSQRGP